MTKRGREGVGERERGGVERKGGGGRRDKGEGVRENRMVTISAVFLILSLL